MRLCAGAHLSGVRVLKTGTRSGTHTGLVIELLRVALRSIGVVCPAAGVLGIVGLRGGGADDGGFGTFLGAMVLSLLAAAAWSAFDARRGLTARVAIRWVATTVLISGGLSLWERVGVPDTEFVSTALSYSVPMLVAVGLGWAAAVGAAREQRTA